MGSRCSRGAETQRGLVCIMLQVFGVFMRVITSFLENMHFFSLFDVYGQTAKTCHLADEAIARDHSGNAFGGAGENQVARLQFPGGGQVLDGFSDVPDQFVHVAALAV